jgi:hypothetical protein
MHKVHPIDALPEPAPSNFEAHSQGLPFNPISFRVSTEIPSAPDSTHESFGPSFISRQATKSQKPSIHRKFAIADVYGMIPLDLEDGHDADPDVIVQVIRGEMGRKAAAPCNFHQATYFFNLRQKRLNEKRTRLMMFLSSALIWLQLISVLAFVYGIYNSTCGRNSDCFAGQFCSPSGLKQMLCHPCVREWSSLCAADGSFVTTVGFSANLWEKSIWPEQRADANTFHKMCLACVVEGAYLPGRDAARGNVTKMSSADVFIFGLCLALISLSVVNELRDIFLCSLSRLEDPVVTAAAYQRRADGMKPIPLAILSLVPSACSNWKTHWVLFLHQCLRQYAVLPVLIMAIPMLVVVQGSSGVSICLNSVGVLFVLEMDNLAYQFGIQEQDREVMEAEGAIFMNSSVHASLTRMKNFHLFSVPLGIIATLVLIYSDITGPYHLQIVWMVVCSLSFWLCGLAEAFIVTGKQAIPLRVMLLLHEVFKMIIGELAIWIALCILYPYFIPRFFSGAFW